MLVAVKGPFERNRALFHHWRLHCLIPYAKYAKVHMMMDTAKGIQFVASIVFPFS